jgi:hypothetical protein
MLYSPIPPPSTFRFKVDASQGVTPSLDRGGSVVFANGEGNVVLVMPAPVMYDSDGAAAPGDAVAYSLEPAADSSNWTLDVSVDREWLAAPDRTWLVMLDPSLTLPETPVDCVLVSVDQLERCGNTGWPAAMCRPSAGSYPVTPLPGARPTPTITGTPIR